MAKLKAVTYKDLDKLLGDKRSVTIGNNTVASRLLVGTSGPIVIKLHGHPIVIVHGLEDHNKEWFAGDYWDIHLQGYNGSSYPAWGQNKNRPNVFPSRTTMDRINQFIGPAHRLFQRNWKIYLDDEMIDPEDYDAWICVGYPV